MDALLEICRDHGLLLIEDACQAHGAEYKGRKVGSFGDCAVFSFYPTKNMTTGEGGMITTDSREMAEKARVIRDHGSKTKYHHEVLGYNYRSTDIAAAIGIEQLKKLDKMNGKRIKNAEALTRGMEKLKGIVPPFVSHNVKHVFHQYTVRIVHEHCSRDSLARMLNEKGIATGIYYPVPIPYQKLYRQYGGRYPEADRASREVLSLPVHPGISGKEIEFILSSLASCL
jgi:dTDP-4-amino-4,6-dideoxygalactose transaminase